MTTFKVGDRVRSGARDGTIAGDDGGDRWPLRVSCDDGTMYWMERDGSNNSACEIDMTLITPATDELAELRAWKDAAIAKHPDLAPVDPDSEGALQALRENGYHDPHPERDEIGYGIAMAAIRWARANPR